MSSPGQCEGVFALASSGATLPTAPLRATATLDFPSVAATGGTQNLTITVTGAAVGDPVAYTGPAINAGLVPYAFVSAANVVTIRLTNMTGLAIDPAAGSWTVAVFKP